MQMTPELKQLAAALAAAQAEIKNPAFDSVNPHFRSNYASLPAVRDAIMPALAKNGIALTQWPVVYTNKDGVMTAAGVRTILIHSSGEKLEDTLFIPLVQQSAHGIGSAITYARRFAMQSIAGVAGDDDDDGNEAVGKTGAREAKPQPKVRSSAGAPAEDPEQTREFFEGEGILKLKECKTIADLTTVFNSMPVDVRRPGTKVYDTFKDLREAMTKPAKDPADDPSDKHPGRMGR